MSTPLIDLDRLLKLHLVVARFGEMDLAKWWNTKEQLGRLGTAALRLGFPLTHRFAQAGSVFAVAAHRCAEIFDPPKSVTLWRLPEALEEEFDARWELWLDHAAEWKYDWAHLAMHLWPERVVPKCAKDRSLAIAHGLEDVFWVEGEGGKVDRAQDAHAQHRRARARADLARGEGRAEEPA